VQLSKNFCRFTLQGGNKFGFQFAALTTTNVSLKYHTVLAQASRPTYKKIASSGAHKEPCQYVRDILHSNHTKATGIKKYIL
jgi:hypothetical protein